jgi:hypothetical protein
MFLLPLLLLAGCGGSSPSPPPVPAPVPWAGSIQPSQFTVTESSAQGAASIGVAVPQVDGNGMFAFPQCANASACWTSYVEATFPQPVSLLGRNSVTLTYSVTMSPDAVFDCQSPNNTPNCGHPGASDWPASVRLLLQAYGDNNALVGGQATGRAFSTYIPLVAGAGQVKTVPLTPDGFATALALSVTMSRLGRIGICFGGGTFDCHGLAMSAGSASFQINGYVVQ